MVIRLRPRTAKMRIAVNLDDEENTYVSEAAADEESNEPVTSASLLQGPQRIKSQRHSRLFVAQD
jgi:hypothetical protein